MNINIFIGCKTLDVKSKFGMKITLYRHELGMD